MVDPICRRTGFEAIVVNDGDSVARMSVQVACVKSTKKARARAGSNDDLRAELEVRVKRLRQGR